MTIKQLNKKINNINELIVELDGFRDSVVSALETKKEAIEEKADDRDSGQNTEREEERIAIFEEQILNLESLEFDEIEEACE